MPPYNLFGLESQDYVSAKVVVLPVPYDSTASYKAGAREGPHAIIQASRNIELYSEELGTDISKIGIYTLDELEPDVNSAEGMVNRIEKEVSILLNDSKIPLLLGGDHSISIGAFRAVGKAEKNFSILHFDAHSDSREEYMGSRYSHACVAARARELSKNCYSVGVRSIDEDSANIYRKEILYMADMKKLGIQKTADTIVRNTLKNVYLTIDLDVLDPSIMPSTGTPEPDGMDFGTLTGILKAVLGKKKLLGMDMTELCPIPGMAAPDYTAAKLAYLTLGYALAKKQ